MTQGPRLYLATIVMVLVPWAISLTEAQSPRATAPAPPLRTDAIARVARLRANSVVFIHTVTHEETR
jgi:hypothetical protein